LTFLGELVCCCDGDWPYSSLLAIGPKEVAQ